MLEVEWNVHAEVKMTQTVVWERCVSRCVKLHFHQSAHPDVPQNRTCFCKCCSLASTCLTSFFLSCPWFPSLAKFPMGLFSSSFPSPSLNDVCYIDGCLPSSRAAVPWSPFLLGWPDKLTSDSSKGKIHFYLHCSSGFPWAVMSIELFLVTNLRSKWLYYYNLCTD